MQQYPDTLRTLDSQVDLTLQKLALAPTLSLPVNKLYAVTAMNEESYLLDHFMLEKGLIKISNDGRTLTAKGLEISNFGGWLAYQVQLKKDKSRNSAAQANLRNQLELNSLRDELEKYKMQLDANAEKAKTAEALVKSLMEQSKNNNLITLLTGVVIGVVSSSILWYFLFA